MPRTRSGDGRADLIVSGNLLTSNRAQPRAQAAAIRDGRFVRIGTRREIEQLRGPTTERLDVASHTVLPGMIDTHAHPLLLGRTLRQFDCSQANEPAKLLAALGAAIHETKGTWVQGHSYVPSASQPALTRTDLDRVSRGRPVILTHRTGHMALVNSTALDIAGITADTPDPQEGTIERDGQGQPTGVLHGSAQGLVRAHLPTAGLSDHVADLRRASKRYAAAGITTAAEAAMGYVAGMDEWRAAVTFAQDLPDVRLAGAMVWPCWADGGESAVAAHAPDAWLRLTGVKFFQDGAIPVRTAALMEPYLGESEHRGDLVVPTGQLVERLREVDGQGWQVWIHAHGDRAVESAVDAIGTCLAGRPKRDHRHRIEHAQLATVDQLSTMARHGIAASFYPVHIWHWGDQHRVEFLGADRASRINPLASAARAGVPFAIHTDSPATDLEPLRCIAAAVTRRTSGGRLLGPAERISLNAAISAYTVQAAYLIFAEHERGRLAEGMLADLTVLDADLDHVHPSELADVRVRYTVLGGRIAHSAEA